MGDVAHRFFTAQVRQGTLRALLTETKVESGDVSKQKWNLC